ncbi:MAG TPA: SDR family NAD(P)-dependent oxidoreductase [Gemmatimonadaceae bacterium]|nr:SDR family NAD(P)-dependent oxidoreductase [Gemmatimonadaceae bacterium]
MDLSEARVLVTGGGSGIGRATAQLLAARGARVAICGRRADRLREAADAIGAVAIPADVSDETSVRDLLACVVRELGGYDVLINNAGFGTFASLVDTDAAEFRRVWETNVLGAMLVARESARHFVARRRGNIVNVASTAGTRGFAGGTAYCATKFALSGMTECWRAELRKHDVRVMQVNPSEVLTDFFEVAGAGARADNPTKLRAEDIAFTIASMLELPDRGFVTEATVWATNPRD